MYSLNAIIFLRKINNYISSYFFTLIFSAWVIHSDSNNLFVIIGIFVINFLIVITIRKICEFLVKQVYKPQFYLRKTLTYVQVIENQTMSQKKDNEIYDDEEQFISRKEFEIKRFNIWITYVFTLIFLIVFWSLFQNNPLIEEYLHINWRNIFSIIFYLSAYEMLLTAIEAYFYEKARFGEARIRGIVLDYSIFVLIFLLIGLWLMLDSNSLSKIVHFLVWFYTWNQK